MKTTKRIFIYFSAVILIALSQCSRDHVADLGKRVTAGYPIPDGVMDTLRDMYHMPGASIAMVHNGQIEWVRGYCVREYGKPERVDTNTIFQAASLSKPVSAVAALKMVDKGALALDENVNLKLHSWKVPENEFTKNRSVTLRRLLSHSAGLPMHGVPEFPADAELPTLIQILNSAWSDNAKPVRPIIEPGTEYRYSGGGDIVLQVLLTDISKRPFAELAQALVLKPAGMVSSTFEQPLPQQFWPRAATGHRSNQTPLEGRWNILPEQAAGGLWTTPKTLHVS